jgi:hypothetical protein
MTTNETPRLAVAALCISFGLGACGGTTAGEDAGSADKAAFEEAAALLKQPVALISVYQSHLGESDGKDPYAPKRRNDLQKAAAAAAGEIRFAANGARQKFKSSPATKDLEAALAEISKSCSDATETTGFEKCSASVKALDAVLVKAAAAATAAGATAKIPHVEDAAITEEAKKAIAPFLKALKPGTAEQAYFAKRGDAKAAFGAVSSACQAATDEVSTTASGFEKAERPLRLVAVTHKLSLESQCRTLEATDGLKKDFEGCRKKIKTSDCKVVCAKVKTRVEEGLPAALFKPMEEEANKLCDK